MNTPGPPALAVQEAIRSACGEGRTALTAFLTAGYPSRAAFLDILSHVAGLADVVEVGVPFTDPMADGVTIQRASATALKAGVTLDWILDTIPRARPRAPVLLMSYLNPLLAFGIERLADKAAECGVEGLIVPDLPLEESSAYRVLCEPRGLGLVQFVTPLTPEERMSALCETSRGFVYAITRTGTTGGGFDRRECLAMLERVRRHARIPVQAGFGVREPEQVRSLAPHVDGLIVGSALIERLERGEDPLPFLRSLMEAGAVGVRPTLGAEA